MKIVVASDKYKESLSALEVCTIIIDTIKKLDPTVELVASPMADGGDGTVDTLIESLKGKKIEMEVTGPMGDKIHSGFGMLGGDTAVIEMAAASGLALVPSGSRNPMETTTYGTGELLKKALEMGSRKVIMGIGGSATTDGGMGMAQALGYEFLGKDGEVLGFGGKQLQRLENIKDDKVTGLLLGVKIEVSSDVDNPLYGKKGAAYVYGPQKGASPEMVKEIDKGLVNFAEVVLKDIGKDVRDIPCAGAAGGLGAGMIAFAGAVLRMGTEIVIDVTGLEEKIIGADLIITGEGAMDKQTFFGKSAFGVARLASRYNIPVITINGSVLVHRDSIDKKNSSLFSGNFSIINSPMILEEAIEDAEGLLERATREIIGFYIDSKKDVKKQHGG